MTLAELQALLASIDPDIRHGWTMADGRDYTWWQETARLPLVADDRHIAEGWVFYVHRFSKANIDPIAEDLFETLDGLPNLAVAQEITFEPETGYSHFVYRCEVI